MLFLDLDRFKLVNDSLGHLVGDELLMAVAQRSRRALRPGDTVARLGGDEFTLLLDDIGDVHGASVVAERAAGVAARRRSRSATASCTSSASIGIALVTAGPRARGVVRDADVAMYRAKAEGGARHAVFDAGDARPGDGAARAGDRPAARARGRRSCASSTSR